MLKILMYFIFNRNIFNKFFRINTSKFVIIIQFVKWKLKQAKFVKYS